MPHRSTGSPRPPASGPAADEGLARRMKALACTAPLHDLDVRKSGLAGQYAGYEVAEVALAAVDLVTLSMDFDTGADHERMVSPLLPGSRPGPPTVPPPNTSGSPAGCWRT